MKEKKNQLKFLMKVNTEILSALAWLGWEVATNRVWWRSVVKYLIETEKGCI